MTELPAQHPRRMPAAAKTAGLALLLFAATFALFSPSLRYGIMELDDREYVLNNPFVAEGLSAASFRSAFSSAQLGMYTPLVSVSYGLDSALWGARIQNPWGFHFSNILLHSINAALAFLLLLGMRSNKHRALLFAALWAFHPMRVEAVAWLSSRKDVLSGLFALLCLLSYLYAHARTATPSRPRARPVLHYLSLAMFGLSLFSKSSVVPIPLALLLLDIWPLGRLTGSGRSTLRPLCKLVAEKIPFGLLAVVMSFVTASGHEGLFALKDVSLPVRLLSVPVHYAFYVVKTVFPAELSPLYCDPAPSGLLVGLSIFLLGVLTTVAWTSRLRDPQRLVGWLVFLGLLVPVAGWVRFGAQAIADRFTYLPAMGLSMALVSIWPSAPERRSALSALRFPAALGFLILFAAGTWRLLPTWKSPTSFYTRILSIQPDHPRGLELRVVHAIRTAGDFPKAYEDLQKILSMGEFTHFIPEYMALCLAELEGPAAAKEFLVTFPDMSHPLVQHVLYWNRARYSLMLAQYDDAIRDSSLALQTLPHDTVSPPFLHLLIMVAAYEKGDMVLALEHARRLPAFANRTSLELADLLPYYLSQWNEFHRTDAYAFFQRVIRSYPERIGLLNNIAWGLATANWSPAGPDEVLALAQQVNQALPNPDPGALDTLAAAQANAGDFAQAGDSIQRALALLPDSNEPHVRAFRARLQARQALYQQQRPYREHAFARWMNAEFNPRPPTLDRGGQP